MIAHLAVLVQPDDLGTSRRETSHHEAQDRQVCSFGLYSESGYCAVGSDINIVECLVVLSKFPFILPGHCCSFGEPFWIPPSFVLIIRRLLFTSHSLFTPVTMRVAITLPIIFSGTAFARAIQQLPPKGALLLPIKDVLPQPTEDLDVATPTVVDNIIDEQPTEAVEIMSSVPLLPASDLDDGLTGILDATSVSDTELGEATSSVELDVSSSVVELVEESSGIGLDFSTSSLELDIPTSSAPLFAEETSSIEFEFLTSSLELDIYTSSLLEFADKTSSIEFDAPTSSFEVEIPTSSVEGFLEETSSIEFDLSTSSIQLDIPTSSVEGFLEETSSIEFDLSTSSIEFDEAPTSSVPEIVEETSSIGLELPSSSITLDFSTSSAPDAVEQTSTVLAIPTDPAVIQKPVVIIVKQITYFIFPSALGGLCPAVRPAPFPGGFLVGEFNFGRYQDACLAACNIQFNQCLTAVGFGIQGAQCRSQLTLCHRAAGTATVTQPLPTTVTQTVILPPEAVETDPPAVTSKIIDAGGEVITSTVLPDDEVATIGTGGVSIITVTATPTPTPEPQPGAADEDADSHPSAVTSVVTVTLPPNPAHPGVPQISTVLVTVHPTAGVPETPVTSIVTVTLPPHPTLPDVPQLSTATITIHPTPLAPTEPQGQAPAAPAAPKTSVVTVTLGGQTGIITMTVPDPAAPTPPNNLAPPDCPACASPATVVVTETKTQIITQTVDVCGPAPTESIASESLVISESLVVTESGIPIESIATESPLPTESIATESLVVPEIAVPTEGVSTEDPVLPEPETPAEGPKFGHRRPKFFRFPFENRTFEKRSRPNSAHIGFRMVGHGLQGNSWSLPGMTMLHYEKLAPCHFFSQSLYIALC
ncbi:hypothetical protein ACRALDRAFT_207334 [Sodiomyces alcalophilus JCM 7366]|uniref:uncharacterized protein n=1 Tax=Sodiomyces alcalophilus JCM 7366 TaxID=591952 RepID=UPI0039B3E775